MRRRPVFVAAATVLPLQRYDPLSAGRAVRRACPERVGRDACGVMARSASAHPRFLEYFTFEKGGMRGGGTAPPGREWAEKPRFFRETPGRMV